MPAVPNQPFNPGSPGDTIPPVLSPRRTVPNGSGNPQDDEPNINANTQPPALKTLIYSPDVRVIIAHNGKQYDVSSDIVRCSLHRVEDSAATFFMTLSNKGLRYTPAKGKPVFSRMDRIVVYMKRDKFVQVFSGYLDTIPYKQLYPGMVNFKATCTLKRLLHTWWNPSLGESQKILQQIYREGSEGDGQGGGQPAPGTDSGLGSMLRRVLILVGGWKIENIHIQNFPTAFFDFLQQQAKKNQGINDEQVEKFKHMLLGYDITAGPGNFAGANSSAGVPGPNYGAAGIAGGSTAYVAEIVQACDDKGLGPIVSDNNVAAGLAQAGETGQNTNNPTQQKAWQQVGQTNLDQQQANRDSDAAIIAVAVSMVETGGGTPTLHNYSNPAVPGSEAYGEGPPPFPADGDSCGLFQQRPAGHDTVAKRMNPRQAAAMFFGEMIVVAPGWRNQDRAATAQQVQRGNGTQPKYAAVMDQAKAIVQGFRTGGGGQAAAPTNAAMGAAGGGGASGGGGGGGVVVPNPYNLSDAVRNTGRTDGGVFQNGLFYAKGTTVPGPGQIPSGGAGGSGVNGQPSTSPNPVQNDVGSRGNFTGGAGVGRPGKPVPDSEGAVQFALSKAHRFPYVWGGKGPSGYDCSGLVSAAFASIGRQVPSTTGEIRASIQQISKSQAGRGDIYEPEGGHVAILLGPPGTTLVQASTDNVPLPQQINVHTWYGGDSEWYGRVCENGGPDPTSPYNETAIGGAGIGVPPGTGDEQAGFLGTANLISNEPIARNLFSYIFTNKFSDETASDFIGEKAFIMGEPLIQVVSSVCGSSLRRFQSAPNGDFMAYYPDWWGLDGKPSVFRLEDIELKDVNIQFSDDPLTTHVYIAGDLSKEGLVTQSEGWLQTAGVVTVEDEWIYKRLVQIAPGDLDQLDGKELMRRFGVRPYKDEKALAGTAELEIILACSVFQQKWAEQYQTTISMTFMPELYPGMRVELAGHNLSVYVTGVSHSCDFESGFSTQATIVAPGNPNGKTLISRVKTPTGPTQFLQRGFDYPDGTAIVGSG